MPSKATPVGRNKRKGATIAASFGSVKKFWITRDMPRLSRAKSHTAAKSFKACPNDITSELNI